MISLAIVRCFSPLNFSFRLFMSAIKREFQLKKCSLDYAYPERILWCQWQLKPRITTSYLVYRWVFAIYFIVTLVYVLHAEPLAVKCPDPHGYFQDWEYLARWPVYLTNWGYLLLVFKGLYAAILVTSRYVKESLQEDPKPCKMCGTYKFYWAMHTIAVVTAIGITITYWITVYCPTEAVKAHGVLKHIMNSICMVGDFFIVSIPYRILHVHLPVLFVAAYLAFSAVYYLAGGLSVDKHTYLYTILIWEHPGKALINCILGLIFVAFLHLVVYFLYLFRRWLYLKLIVPLGAEPVMYCNSVAEVTTPA